MVPHPVRAYRSKLLTSEKLRMERLISGVLGSLSLRRSYLRKPSHRPVYILPNARREVSSGLSFPLRPFCSDARSGALGQSAWNECRWGYLVRPPWHHLPSFSLRPNTPLLTVVY